MNSITLIIPCHNEQNNVKNFYETSIKVIKQLPLPYYEYIFVDDGSADNTLAEIKKLTIRDECVKYLSFSRNFGKEAAIFAGLQHVSGDFAAILDADMQDPPELLLEMYQTIKNEELDCVAARRENRKGEPPIRSFFAKKFYTLINKMADINIPDGARDFRLMKRNMIDSLITLGEKSRFSKGLFAWTGFRTKYISYENIERYAGRSNWSFWSLLKYSIEGIITFSSLPLSIASFFGIAFSFIASILILYFVIQKLIWGIAITGWATMMCLILLLGGVQLLCIGVLGQYIAKLFVEVKNRPVYILREHSFGDYVVFNHGQRNTKE